ncbi:MAG: ABC transporter substrate-binding protein [Tissierellia bacterium]|jgi:iron complex transport system substrate-binding protein|nr:ABC transporter substrate-binding protein [Tissierellia bacterium]
MKKALFSIMILIVLLNMTGCGKTSKVYPLEPDEDQIDIAVSDMLGGQLRLEEAAQRLIVFSPAACEIIADLGEAERIQARGELCNNPKELEKVPLLTPRDLSKPETLDILDSDLIIMDASIVPLEDVDRLYKAGMAVLLLESKNIEDIYRSTEIIGKALGKNLAAKELIRYMSTQWESLLKASKGQKNVRIYIQDNQIPASSLGRNTLIGSFLEELGYENISKIGQDRAYTPREVELLNPDFILVLGDPSLSFGEEFSGVRAVKEKNLIYWGDSPRLAGSQFVEVLKDLMTLLR